MTESMLLAAFSSKLLGVLDLDMCLDFSPKGLLRPKGWVWDAYGKKTKMKFKEKKYHLEGRRKKKEHKNGLEVGSQETENTEISRRKN